MTNDKLDLNSIPHPRDCHRVPVGATIPKGMYVWSQPWSDTASYAPAAVDVVVRSGDVCLTAKPIPGATVSASEPDPIQEVEPFRHPFVSGKSKCPECGRLYEAHGWIDHGSHGFTVCPFDFTPTGDAQTAPVPAPTPEDSPIIASGVCRHCGDEIHFTDAIAQYDGESWVVFDVDGDLVFVTTDDITEWHPAIVTATGHGVMDDRDKRDRMLSHGDRVGWIDSMEVWGFPGGGECYGTLAAIAADWDEDLRFADEVQS